MRVLLVTGGDRTRRSGGYIFLRSIAEGLSRLGDEVTAASLPLLPTPLILASSVCIPAAAARFRSDVVVVDAGIAGGYAAPLALLADRLPFPLVALLLQPPQATLDGPRTRVLLESLLLRRSAAVVTVGRWIAAELERLGVDPRRVRVIGPGCDPPGEQPNPLERETGEEIRFLCVANWLPLKGIDGLVRAFAHPALRHCTLELLGDQTVSQSYALVMHETIDRLGLRERVTAPGSVPWAEVGAHYRRAGVFVLPSFSEGLPTVCVEAFRHGLPVIAYRIPALQEAVTDGVDSLLVGPGDTERLAESMALLARDPVLRRRLAQNALERAKSLPTWMEQAAVFRQVLLEVRCPQRWHAGCSW